MSKKEHIVEFTVSGNDNIPESQDSSDSLDSPKNPEETDTQEPPHDQEQPEAPTPHVSTLSGILGNKTLEDVIEREAKEEQDTSTPFSISKTLGGVIITRFVQKQIGVVILIVFFLIIYISIRYTCQQRKVEINRIEKSIEKAHYKATVCSSMLTEKSRESNVLKRLEEFGENSLTTSNEPPYLIQIDEE